MSAATSAAAPSGRQTDPAPLTLCTLLALGLAVAVAGLDVVELVVGARAVTPFLMLKALLCALWTVVAVQTAFRATGGHAVPLLLFALFLTLFLVVFPAIAHAQGWSYVLLAGEEQGLSRSTSVAIYSLVTFYLVHVLLASEARAVPTTASGASPAPVLAIGVLYCLIGAAAAIWLDVSVSAVDSLSYGNINAALTGQGWLIRLSELLALGGLLLCIKGLQDRRPALVAAGLACLFAFCVFRVQFLNRENVVKYLYVALILWLVVRVRVLSGWQIAALLVGTGLLLSALPAMSLLRAALAGNAEIFTYSEFFVRDFGFAEVAGALYADERLDGALGLGEGLRITLEQLVPRALFPEKSFPIAVRITADVTLVKGYNPSSPFFAYAPSFVGACYYISGTWFVIVYAAALAILTAGVSRWAYGAANTSEFMLRALVFSIFIFQFLVSGIKLDIGSVVAAGIIPIAAAIVPCLQFWSLLRVRSSRP